MDSKQIITGGEGDGTSEAIWMQLSLRSEAEER